MEIGVNKGHYLPEETTYEGPTWVNVGACVLLKLIINERHDGIETGHVLCSHVFIQLMSLYCLLFSLSLSLFLSHTYCDKI